MSEISRHLIFIKDTISDMATSGLLHSRKSITTDGDPLNEVRKPHSPIPQAINNPITDNDLYAKALPLPSRETIIRLARFGRTKKPGQIKENNNN